MTSTRSTVARMVAATTGYSVIAVVALWPVVRHIATRAAGDETDPWQTLWGFWLWRSHPPIQMWTDLLWWPGGVSVWFQTWDLPSTALAVPLGMFLEPITTYNVLVIASFVVSGVAFYWLCLELYGADNYGPAWLSGCIYTFSSFHFASAAGVLHMASIEWMPIYVLALFRTVRRASLLWPCVGGAALAAATLASPYHLVACLTVTLALGVWSLTAGERPSDLGATTRRLALVTLVFSLMLGWYLVGLFRAYRSGPYIGAHDPLRFSVDLMAILFPNPISRWSADIPVWKHWVSSQWGGATGLWAGAAGLGVVNLCILACSWNADRFSRRFVVTAAVGAVLALGPVMQVNGAMTAVHLPYAWLSALFPIMTFGGVPSRFFSVAVFGTALAGCGLLTRLWRAPRLGPTVAALVVCLALAEAWPQSFPTSSFSAPPILRDIAANKDRFVILDATWWSRALYHQTIHGHPILTGYVSRLESAKIQALMADPSLLPFYRHLLPPSPTPSTVPSPDDTLRRLHELNVRYVIVDTIRRSWPESLGLRAVYADDDVVFFVVPERPPNIRPLYLTQAPPLTPRFSTVLAS